MSENIFKRLKDGIKYSITGVKPSTWFSPLQPLQPIAQQEEYRQFDYMPGYNLLTQPKVQEKSSYKELRALADNCDILRLVIETRKDQIKRFKYSFKITSKTDIVTDLRTEKLTEFFKCPDKEHMFEEWIGALLEDMFVIDAATIYPRKTLGGDVYSLDLVDGATITKKIDGTGRTPKDFDSVAYQQILKGVPAIDYSYDELVYKPRNVRTNKVYGFSQVEQIITTVNIAIRKQIEQISYYTEGNTPNLIFTAPQDWSPKQIQQFQQFWDEMNADGVKNNAKFVPNGINVINTKPEPLKNEFDEWLARIICNAFNVSPQAFIKEMNRATAESAQETAINDGLAPILSWVSNLINFIIVNHFGYNDISFVWDLEEEADPLIKAQIDNIYIMNGVKKINEVRKELSLDPIDEEVIIVENEENKNTIKYQYSELKKKDTTKLKRFNKKHLEAGAKKIKSILVKYFNRQEDFIVEQVIKGYSKIKKDDKEITAQSILEDIMLDNEDLDITINDIEKALTTMMAISGADALKNIKKSNKENIKEIKEIVKNNANERAKQLLTEKDDMNIIDNMMNGLDLIVNQAMLEGWSNDELANSLSDAYSFSDVRANMIARTETNRADNKATLEGFKVGKVQKKRWLTAQDDLVSDICLECEAEGVIDIDDDFISGDSAPPSHPNCRCTLIAVFEE